MFLCDALPGRAKLIANSQPHAAACCIRPCSKAVCTPRFRNAGSVLAPNSPAILPRTATVAPVYRTRVGAMLPASVVVTPLPAAATVQVPAVQPYSYATVDGRVLLVDPASNTVVADITP